MSTAARRIRKPKEPPAPKQYLCTECGGDAFIAYSAGFDDKVKPGERLCTRCFVRRGGKGII